jgi:DNA-binding CsgD family transcriptional regulator
MEKAREEGKGHLGVELSAAEFRYLQLVLDGLPRPMIAEELGVHPALVEELFQTVTRKLGKHARLGRLVSSQKTADVAPSAREKRMLVMRARGMSYDEIARLIGVSRQRVYNHLGRLARLHLVPSGQLVAYALVRGWISTHDLEEEAARTRPRSDVTADE